MRTHAHAEALLRLALLALTAACGSGTVHDGKPSQAGAGAGGAAGTQTVASGNGGNGGNGGIGGIGGISGIGAVAGGGTSAAGTGGNAGERGDGFTVKVELASDIKPTAPTTVGIVTWSVDEPALTEAHIDFGLDESYGMTAPVELERPELRTVLVGMKPAKTYHFRIVASAGGVVRTSDDRTFTTGGAPSVRLLNGIVVSAAEKVDRGFFITSYWSVIDTTDATWTVFMFDTDGDVVWWYTPSDLPEVAEKGFSRARLSANSHDVWLAQVTNGGAPLRRVSIDTLEEQTYPDTRGSHDIAAVSGDSMAYLDYGETDCESIFEIDKSGMTKEVFESTGVTSSVPPSSPCHGNSVRYSQKQDAYVFSDDYNDVVVLGRDGTVRWKLSEKVSGGNTSWGGYQHGTQLLDDSLLIFANRGGGDINRAEAIEFGLDGSVLRRFTTTRTGGDFLGDVQRLPSGNTLIDYSSGSVMDEVDANDEVVLSIFGKAAFGYVEFRSSLYGEPLDIRQ